MYTEAQMLRRFLNNITAVYGPTGPARLIGLYRRSGGPWRYLTSYWSTQQFAELPVDRSCFYRPVQQLLIIGILGQDVAAVRLFAFGVHGDYVSGVLLGLALVASAPVIWAHILFLLAAIWHLRNFKSAGKNLLCGIFEAQYRELRERNDFTVIAVAGSIGKTSTKLAIAQLLEAAGKKVCYQLGNYNDRLTVPLVVFGQTQPSLYNVFAWARIWRSNRQKLQQAYPYNIVVVELGIDGPGQMDDFAYLRPELAVVTAVSEEHMAFFKTIDVVAREELKVFDFSKQVLVNTDDVDAQYLHYDSYDSYGLTSGQYRAALMGGLGADGQKLQLDLGGDKTETTVHLVGAQGAKAVLAAATIAHMLGIDTDTISTAAADLQPHAGRMQLLSGIKNTLLIDDTYNASPRAVTAALDVLYAADASQRIAILGSMNEMGELSMSLHREVGAYCDSAKLDYVVTIGRDAKSFLAPAAKQAGCNVKSFTDPHKAGAFVAKELKNQAVVLAKGSQNGVFAEEALKPLLNDPADAAKLVRQSAYWLKIKRKQFGA